MNYELFTIRKSFPWFHFMKWMVVPGSQCNLIGILDQISFETKILVKKLNTLSLISKIFPSWNTFCHETKIVFEWKQIVYLHDLINYLSNFGIGVCVQQITSITLQIELNGVEVRFFHTQAAIWKSSGNYLTQGLFLTCQDE